MSSGSVASSISAMPGVVALLPGQRLPLRGERLVERRPDLVEGAAEVAAAAGPRSRIRRARSAQLVEPAPAVEPTTHQVPQRLAQRASGQHVRPTSSSASRTSYGGASGSGPPCQGP